MVELQASLDELVRASETVWSDYLANGPGKLEQATLHPFAAALLRTQQLLQTSEHSWPRGDWESDLEAVVLQLESILTRCVERTEGLSFVTGEAGLIPRRDLHEKCEELLEQLRQLVRELTQ